MEIVFIRWEGSSLKEKTWPFLFHELHNELRNLVLYEAKIKHLKLNAMG